MVHNSRYPQRVPLPWCETFFLSIACEIILSIVCKCSCSSFGAGSFLAVNDENYTKFVVIYFLYDGKFCFTMPIQDYSNGPCTWDGGGQVESSILGGLVSWKWL